jgi:hypothetical protein
MVKNFLLCPVKQLNQTFNFTIPGITNQPAQKIANVVARSFGTESIFSVAINNQPIVQMNIPPVSSGALDLFAQTAQFFGNFLTNSPEFQHSLTIPQEVLVHKVGSTGLKVHARSNPIDERH